MRVVDLAEIRSVVSRGDALEAAERAFRALAEDRVRLPDPVGLHLPEVEGEVHVKGGHVEGEEVFAFKVASGFYRNAERGLPTGSGLFLVFDATTGLPLALLRDGGWLTELRTGAAGALAARHLTPERPLVVAVIGAGTQARFQIEALAGVRAIAGLRVWAPHVESARICIDDVGSSLPEDTPAVPVATVEEAVRGAELVITVTPSREPLLEEEWVGEGATVVAVGSDGPGKRELPTALMAAADRIVVDRVVQSVELGELEAPVAEGVWPDRAVVEADPRVVELGEVVVGRAPGRGGPSERIVCDLTGVGAQDVTVAALAWRRLERAGRGG